MKILLSLIVLALIGIVIQLGRIQGSIKLREQTKTELAQVRQQMRSWSRENQLFKIWIAGQIDSYHSAAEFAKRLNEKERKKRKRK